MHMRYEKASDLAMEDTKHGDNSTSSLNGVVEEWTALRIR